MHIFSLDIFGKHTYVLRQTNNRRKFCCWTDTGRQVAEGTDKAETDYDIDRKTERHKIRQTDSMQKYRHADTQIDTKTHRKKDTQIDRQTAELTDTQTGSDRRTLRDYH